MKLAFSLFKYFPYGGLQRDFFAIASACHARGHEIHVYTMSWEGDKPAQWHIHLIPVASMQNHNKNHYFAKSLQVRLKQDRPDLVIGFNKMPGLSIYYAADVCFRARAHERHGFLYRLLPRYRVLARLENAVFARGATTRILLMSAAHQAIFQHYYGTEDERFHVLPPGIARDRMAPSDAPAIRAAYRTIYGLSDDDILLLMVGSGFKTKGLDRILYAVAALPAAIKLRTQLFVIGQDNPVFFKKLAVKLKLENQIRFLGGRHDVPKFLLAADLLVHPAYHENAGMVLLEAIISGLPVLATDVCGYAHYIKSTNTGMVLSSPFQQLEMNLTLQKMLLSPNHDTWKKNGIAFGKIADIYSLPEKTTEIIESLPRAAYSSESRRPAHKTRDDGVKNTRKNICDGVRPYTFDEFMALDGECFRQQKGRYTKRVMLDNQTYFIKQHTGVGWKEIFKNILQLRWPVLGAKPEKLAIEKLQSLGVNVPVMMAFGQRGRNPARLQSYILMEDLTPVISLEDLCKSFKNSPPQFIFKQQLIREVARIARVMHENNMHHRDLYICHFLLREPFQQQSFQQQSVHSTPKLYLIDLHRAQIYTKLPMRWQIKDLAALYFSSKEAGLTQRDLIRFIESYTGSAFRDILKTSKKFWQKVKARGEKLYYDHQT